jgi:biopolymer transport protein ExbD
MSAGKNTVGKPGFHLRPKYDLKALRKRRNQGGGNKISAGDLPLVSMIDMFSILVIYLLMNFSATGEVFFIQKDLKLPEAVHARPLESAPLITVNAGGVTLETEQVGDNPVIVQESNQELPKLAAALREIRKLEEATKPGQPFHGKVNIQADEATPLIYIKRVMQTCMGEGWTGIHFAVMQKD